MTAAADTGAYTAWAVFATAAAVLQLASLVAPLIGLSASASWTTGAAATVALVGYWVIIVLPGVEQQRRLHADDGCGMCRRGMLALA
ncbi:MAG: hypothetical protein WKF73_06375 [Nocardioidaceae bacterium]